MRIKEPSKADEHVLFLGGNITHPKGADCFLYPQNGIFLRALEELVGGPGHWISGHP